MKVLNKLVKKNLLLNKQRSLVTIVGIILSCALITALISLVTSTQQTLIISSYENYGHRHVTFYDVEKEDIGIIENNKYVESIYLTTNSVGIDENDSYVGITNMDEQGLLDLEYHLLSGRVPENSNEVALSWYYLESYDLKIGDTLSIDTIERYTLDGYPLDGTNPVTDEEYYEVISSKQYTIVGTVSSYITFLSDGYDYKIYGYLEEVEESAKVYALYTEPSNYVEITDTIIDTGITSGHGYNIEYLRWSGYGVTDGTIESLYGLAAIISFIIIASSVFCIRNSFAISSQEKTKLFGMLASMGATPKQIKKSVLKEGFYLGIIGIPLGILSGSLAAYILVGVINWYFKNMSEQVFYYQTSLIGILISIILSVITIYFSAIGSARAASKITEIEAIKNQNDIKISRKETRVPKIINKIFGVSGNFAYKNMKRNKSKFKTTIISLVVSITTFLSLSYFIQIGYTSIESVYEDSTYNISLSLADDEYIQPIVDREEIEDYIVHQIVYTEMPSTYMTKEFIKGYGIDDYDSYGQNTIGVQLLCVNKEKYAEIIQELGYSYEQTKDIGIVINNETTYWMGDNKIETSIIEETNQIIQLYDEQEERNSMLDVVFPSNITIMAQENFYDIPTILISEENEYMENKELISRVYIQSNDPNTTQIDVEEYLVNQGFSISILNIAEIIEAQNNMITLISIFLYGFITVIILIGLTNIFNTLTTNMKLRSKEFAVLKTIGMSEKELKSMIRLESIFYGVKSLFWGLLFGLGLSYLIYLVLTKGDILTTDVLSTFHPPYFAIGITIISVFIVIHIIMNYSLSKIRKQNLIETIKNENI